MSSTNSEGPWYQDGLKFSCSGCGDCCTGAPGFVWVNDDEVETMAERINLSRDDFEDQYTRKIGARRSLKEFSNGDCVFFDHDSRKCEVYDLRPRQCRTWPFWDSNLKSPEAWAETCEDCPGSGQGKLFQIEEIEQRRRVMKI
jgi:Fe-S-cluster containining protein